MNIIEIERKIEEYKSKNLKIFVTSSFQTHSIPLLHIISRIDDSIPVYFLDTGYHFPETLQFKDEISDLLHLNIIDLTSPIPKKQQRDSNGRFMFSSDPEYCCYMNKILPLQSVLKEKNVWISGVRKVQNSNRNEIKPEEKTPDGVLRYHPVLNWTNQMIRNYRNKFDLPPHPLEEEGYFSIGCQPCTRPSSGKKDRSNRWAGHNKTECGLHTELRKANV